METIYVTIESSMGRLETTRYLILGLRSTLLERLWHLSNVCLREAPSGSRV